MSLPIVLTLSQSIVMAAATSMSEGAMATTTSTAIETTATTTATTMATTTATTEAPAPSIFAGLTTPDSKAEPFATEERPSNGDNVSPDDKPNITTQRESPMVSMSDKGAFPSDNGGDGVAPNEGDDGEKRSNNTKSSKQKKIPFSVPPSFTSSGGDAGKKKHWYQSKKSYEEFIEEKENDFSNAKGACQL